MSGEKSADHIVIFKTSHSIDEQLANIPKVVTYTYNHDSTKFQTDNNLYLIWKPNFNIRFDIMRKRFGTLLTSVLSVQT